MKAVAAAAVTASSMARAESNDGNDGTVQYDRGDDGRGARYEREDPAPTLTTALKKRSALASVANPYDRKKKSKPLSSKENLELVSKNTNDVKSDATSQKLQELRMMVEQQALEIHARLLCSSASDWEEEKCPTRLRPQTRMTVTEQSRPCFGRRSRMMRCPARFCPRTRTTATKSSQQRGLPFFRGTPSWKSSTLCLNNQTLSKSQR